MLAADRSRGRQEPDGSAQSLWGKLGSSAMGDRALRERPEGLEEARARRAKKARGAAEPGGAGAGGGGARRRGAAGPSVLDVDSAGLYRPRTKETREAYEALLSSIQAAFGDAPADVLRGAADEVLAVLKNDRLRDLERAAEVRALLGAVPDERFAQMVALGKLVTDYAPAGAGGGGGGGAAEGEGEGALDEEMGVAVEFEDEDEESDGDGVADEEVEESDADEEVGDGAGAGGAVRARRGAAAGSDDDGAAAAAAAADGLVPVQDIDAYWLQRRVARALGDADAVAAQALAEEALAALGAPDAREAEGRLVALLDYARFDLVKELLRSRARVVWCTRLARAQDAAARGAVEAAMAADAGGAAVLEALRATRGTARDRATAREREIREEARRLRAAGGAGAGAEGDGAEGAPAAGAAPARRTVDLDALAFTAGAHFNSAKSTTLPPGSYRTVHKGYEEVHVPALKAPPFAEGERLREIAELPAWARPGFAGMASLNRVQSAVCDAALFSSENLLVCAPTGAGKTNVAMLAMLHEIGLHRRPDGSIDTSAFKMVYVAPMKALVAEMVGNFGARLKPFGVKVRELTGDVSLSREELEDTQLIIVTPEKWDIVTRKAADRSYTALVRLVIIDEIHLLHDSRGPVLEALVARALRSVEATQEVVRLVGLSATLPNYQDVAAFLRVDAARGLFHFDNSYRPCPLAQQYVGVNAKQPLARFKLMDEICYEKVMEAAGKHQVLVFVHSRKDTAKTARFLRDEALRNDALGRLLREGAASREVLAAEAEAVKSAELRELLPHGLGIHHAGLQRADRTLVEDMFADGHIQVLVCTATLAWGVNLPAHTVIIKGTQVYNPVRGGWDELSPLDVVQMLGRAGRPQFDTYGEGVIITRHSELQFYLSLFNTQLPVESQMVTALPDALNAEIALGGVQSIRDAAAWLGYSYLYVRMLAAPALYGVPFEALDADPLLAERRADLAHSAAAILDRSGLVRYDRRSGALQATDLGRVASHFYATHGTIAAFAEGLRPTMTEIELLRLFAAAEEFKFVVVREEEKLELAKLLDRVPIPIKEGLDDPAAKVNALLQAHISRLRLDGLALSADMVYVTQSAGRLMRCLFEVCLRRGWAGLAARALRLAKCVARRQWASQTPLRQFRGVPPEVLARLERKELPWERWYDLSSQEVGELVRLPKMGRTLHRLIHQFPRLELAASVQPVTRSVLKVDLTVTPDFQWDEKVHGTGAEPWLLLVEDADSEFLLHSEPFSLRRAAVEAGDDALISFTVPVAEPPPPQYFVRLVSERWLGAEAVLPISFRHLILPEKNPPPTELLDLAPLPRSALRNAAFEALFPDVAAFNPIQTQAFTALYTTDDNALLCAPAGSGRLAAAEFALLRMISNAAEGKGACRAVYVAPHEAVVAARLADWSARFGGALGLTVLRLAGEPAADLKLLERGNILVATPEAWDALSRRWRQRKAVQEVALLIADELHLIGGARGAALEVVASRARYMASQTGRPLRVVALAASLANARDVADWLGVPPHASFNFPPGARPVPLEVSVLGFEAGSLEARLRAMARPAYAAIGRHAPDGAPAILFAPTRRHARAAALDLLSQAAADGAPLRFRTGAEADVAPFLERVADAATRHALSYGVAILHEGQPEAEASACRALFDAGAAQVLVAAAPCAWGLESSARLVVVMGTQFYDVTGQGTADYAVADLLQMLGRASAPAPPGAGAGRAAAVLMCHAPRKAYYARFLHEPLPVESHLDAFLHDHLAAEVAAKTIRSKQVSSAASVVGQSKQKTSWKPNQPTNH